MDTIKIASGEKKIYENTTLRLPIDVIRYYDALVTQTGLSRTKLMEITLVDGMKRFEVVSKENEVIPFGRQDM